MFLFLLYRLWYNKSQRWQRLQMSTALIRHCVTEGSEQRRSQSSAPSGLSQQYTVLGSPCFTDQWKNIVAEQLNGASDANTQL